MAVSMRAYSWVSGLVGLLLLLVYGLAAWALGGDAALGTAGNDAGTVAIGIPAWAHAVGAAGAVGVGVFLATGWRHLRAATDDLGTTRTTTAVFAVLLALAVAVVLNVMGQRWDTRWDLTATHRYTLSPQSVEIARKLDRQVEIIAFFTAGSPEETNFRDLLDNYTRATTLLKVEFHDPYSDPLLAEQFKLTSTAGTVILKSGDREQRLEYTFDEEAVTNALVKATSDTQHVLCAVEGHGERPARDDQSPTGLGVAVTKLEGQNYTVKTISLTTAPPTPAACEVVLVAAPEGELLAPERDRLAAYVAAGGKLVVLLEALVAPEFSADLARYGVKVGADVVVEADPNRQVAGGDPTFVLLTEDSWDIHPITQAMKSGVILRTARSVGKGEDAPWRTVQVLAHASDSSWAETSVADGRVVANPDEGVDVIGKVPLAVAVEVTDPAQLRTTSTPMDLASAAGAGPAVELAPSATKEAPTLPVAPGGKVVVLGDADFAGNQMVLAGVNQDLLLNSVAWMVGEGEQIGIRANEAGKGKLTLDLVSMFLAGVVSLVAVPGLTIAGAIGTWLVRRKL